MTRIKDMNIRNDVVALITKLSSGWRRDEEDIVSYDVSGTCSMLMEQYSVNGDLILVWAVDILKENSKHIQVLKIWEILPRSQVLCFADNLNILFGNYTVNIMRCGVKQREGNLVIPATWPIDSDIHDGQSLSLATRLSGLSLENGEGKGKSIEKLNLVIPATWPIDSDIHDDQSLSLATRLSGLSLENGKGKGKSIENLNLVIPATWPIDSDIHDDQSLSLATRLSGLSLENGEGKGKSVEKLSMKWPLTVLPCGTVMFMFCLPVPCSLILWLKDLRRK